MLRDFNRSWNQKADTWEKSHQDTVVGAAATGNGEIGIRRSPSPSRGSCQHLGLQLGPDTGMRAWSMMTQLSGQAASSMAPAGIF